MHSYMRAIGFSKKLNLKEQNSLFELILKNPDEVFEWNKPDGVCFTEVKKDIAYNVGICLRGEGRVGEDFVPEYFFPYIKGQSLNYFDEIGIEKHSDKESFAGICDRKDIGLSMIFYLQNVVEHLCAREKTPEKNFRVVSFSGLCIDGKILCPVCEERRVNNSDLVKVRAEMNNMARNGDEKTAEVIALENISEYHQLFRRATREDVYTIVDQAFIPYGVECDIYMIIGNITNVAAVENCITKERLWILNVMCRDMELAICINSCDLLGEPAVGRRFKGEILLQGSISDVR